MPEGHLDAEVLTVAKDPPIRTGGKGAHVETVGSE